MIVIITGASHTGKTLLAQRMLEKYEFPYFSIDHLKMGLKAIWACDEENPESVRLAKRLGFVNPVKYDFLYFPCRGKR